MGFRRERFLWVIILLMKNASHQMIMLIRLLCEYSLSNALDLLSLINPASKLFFGSLGRLGTTGFHGENSFHLIYERKYMRQVFRTWQNYSLLFCVNARCSLGLLVQSTCNARKKTLSPLWPLFDLNGGTALKMFKEMDFEENSLWGKFG